MHDLAVAAGPKDDCCCNDENEPACPLTAPRADVIRALTYLPCCENVISYTSTAEHRRTDIHHAIMLASLFPGIEPPLLEPRIIQPVFVPPPADVGKEILDLNLRI